MTFPTEFILPPANMSDSPESEIRAPIFDKFENESEEPSNADISVSPNTDLSPPDSPTSKSAALSHGIDRRSKSATIAASLSLEEQARHLDLTPLLCTCYINGDHRPLS